MLSLQTKVAEMIKTNAPQQVEDKIIAALVDREVNRRSDALTKAIDNLSKMEGERKRIKPDNVSYNEDGTVKDQSYSKAKTEEIKKLDQKIDKHTKAITKALENQDYGDVYNLGKDQGAGGKSDAGSSDSEAA